MPAHDAAAFRDSVGVNTHISYYSTPYGQWPRIVEKLDELGVDHLRDSVYANPTWGPWNERYYRAVELAAAHGKKFKLHHGVSGLGRRHRPGARRCRRRPPARRGRLARGAERVRHRRRHRQVGGPAVELPRRSCTPVSRLTRGSRASPSSGPASPAARAARRWATSPAWSTSATSIRTRAATRRRRATWPPSSGSRRWSAGRRPSLATEAGFHNALNATTGQPPAPEDVAAVYTVRTLLEHFAAGVGRTFLYELIDESAEPGLTDPEQHFGLLRSDFSEKPAFTALKNLMAVLGRQRAADLEPVEIGLEGDTDAVRRLLLQDADGYKLVLWLDRKVWDRNNHRRLDVPAQDVTLTLPADAATLARPVASAERTPLGVSEGRVAVAVPADPVVVGSRSGRPPPSTRPRRARSPPPVVARRSPRPSRGASPRRRAPGRPAGEPVGRAAGRAGRVLAAPAPASASRSRPAPAPASTRIVVRWCRSARSAVTVVVGVPGRRFSVLGRARIERRKGCSIVVRIDDPEALRAKAGHRRLVVRLTSRSSGRRQSVQRHIFPAN